MLDDTNENNLTFLTNENLHASTSPNLPETPEKTTSRKTVDFVLQGKGGCGKTLIASLLAQYGEESKDQVRCYDADPVNNTLSGVETLCTEVVDLLIDEETNVIAMDRVLSEILSIDANFLIDAGASGFVPLLSYMLRENLFDLLADSGKVVRVHTVIIGGESFVDTISALKDLIQQLPRSVRIYAWLNPFFGPLTNGETDFEESSFWRKEAASVVSGIKLPKLNAAELMTFRKLTAMHKTFAQAQTDPAFNPVERLRLRRIWQPIRDQIESSRLGL